MTFEWDKKKNKLNKKKHGISFKQASDIFLDPNIVINPDTYFNEERWNAIGFVETILFVVFTEKKENTIRIISARKATKRERDEYKKNNF